MAVVYQKGVQGKVSSTQTPWKESYGFNYFLPKDLTEFPFQIHLRWHQNPKINQNETGKIVDISVSFNFFVSTENAVSDLLKPSLGNLTLQPSACLIHFFTKLS